MSSTTRPTGRADRQRRAFWLKQLHQWHWMSSALCLIGLLLFTLTGITLNHAGDIDGAPRVTTTRGALPAPLLRAIRPDDAADAKKPLPAPVAAYLAATLRIHAGGPAEWSTDEIYLALPRPGGDGWVTLDRRTGAIEAEVTDRGWISWLNDLHKGRNAGPAWKWFIDVFAVACLVFAITGLFLLQLHSARRRLTWPIVGMGLLIPAILAVYFVH
ncbi:PepSY-associated TM helix domain-containing protein [Sphingomonas profundi]|uniref:PepSY-associated TM helix domain-containing protein n=1 Tax=Alterirhizorhabdus profundi TaxID=2681549 RepID=UPI0012E8F672|nr:PepSY-associated TM helix domain-containing protein [Sphingomonas profundi]